MNGPNTPEAQVLAIASQKGGTGKTSTAAALAQAAEAEGLRVLAVDMDPQANLSYVLGADANRPGGFELLTGTATAEEVAQHIGRIDVITASRNYSALQSGNGSAWRLRKALQPVLGNYELILIDTPPTGAELLLNGLVAASAVLVTLEASALGMQGLYMIADTIAQVRKANTGLTCKGIVFTRHNPRSTITKQMQEAISATAKGMGIPTLGMVREAVAVKEAQALQTSLYQYAPNSKPAQDYKEILHAITGEA